MKFTFTGCSFSAGVGLEDEKSDINNYCNLVGKHFSAEIVNTSKLANSNYNIFMSALNEILTNKPDCLFVQWTTLSRLWLYPGPDSEIVFLPSSINADYNYRNLHISMSELKLFNKQYHLLNHDYQNILTVINYSNILSKLGNVVFINGLLPWNRDLKDSNAMKNPAQRLSDYTKELLDFDLRDDSELSKLFSILNSAVKTLDSSLWVNMFNSLRKLGIDAGNDGRHPGPESHKKYAKMIIKYLEERK